MALIGIDLGGTKLTLATFTNEGSILFKETFALDNRKGKEVGKLITEKIILFLHNAESHSISVNAIGISVPGISYNSSGTVWAPNIPEWTDYPLLSEVKTVCGNIHVAIDSDRACYILGESWHGNARGCRDAIFLSVGTGIGAGIMINGEILRGSHDIAGCIGWMALKPSFENKYIDCGCFEYYASGEGIAKIAREFLKKETEYSGELINTRIERITSHNVFSAFFNGDELAIRVINLCIEFWGMAVANLISLFNPEKIIIGGGVFGPGVPLIPDIAREAAKWAQPVGINQVTIEASGLAGDAGVFGAGFLALKQVPELNLS